MPVTYDSAKQIFHIKGATFSYIMKLDDDGRLLNLHWGAPLPDSSIDYTLEDYRGGASFDHKRLNLPWEAPARGMGWYGMPAVGAENKNGDDVTDLIYVSHAITPGKRHLDGLPASYVEDITEATELSIIMKDPLTGLRAELIYTVFEKLDVMTRSMQLANDGADRLNVRHMLSASVPFSGDDFDVIHLMGAWARERGIVRQHIAKGDFRIESQRGASGHEHNPFMALTRRETTENSGEAWGMALVYSGSFVAATHVGNFGDARLSIGLNPEVCRWALEPGEAVQTPEAIMAYSAEGLNGMSARYHEVIRTRVCRGFWRDRVRPVLINNWEATYFGFTEEKLMAIARKAADIDVELFVLDDGWFGKRNNDNCSLGDWVVNRDKLTRGIEGVAKDMNAMGLMFGLWFEPEMVSPDSDLYRAHPDWCLHAEGRERTESRNQLILDLSRTEVQDYIIESVSAVLKSAPIGYVKWDMNRNMIEPFSAGRDADRQFETQHRYMLGLYRVLETITSAFPDVLFESCSGGGGRFDCGMLYYMPQTWTSDDTDPVERLAIQYGTSMVYPVSAMGAHVSASPNHQTGRVTDLSMRGDVALGGNFGFEIDLAKLSDDEIETARKMVSTVKSLREITQKGRFIRLMSPFEGNYTAWEFVHGDKVILCVYQRLARPNPCSGRVYLSGLDESAVYTDDATGREYSGAALTHVGLILPRGKDFTSTVSVFTRKG